MLNRKKMIRVLGAFLTAVCVLLMLPEEVQAGTKKYTVTFIYGDKISQQKVSDGGYATIPTDTSIPGFTFLGWSNSAVDVTQDRIILGLYANNTPYAPLTNSFSSVKKINENMSAPFLPQWSLESPEKGVPGVTCIVRWYNSWDSKLWKTEVVPYGTTLADPNEPVEAGIQFIGWEGNWTNITEDRAIKAWGIKEEDIVQPTESTEASTEAESTLTPTPILTPTPAADLTKTTDAAATVIPAIHMDVN